MVQAGVRHSKQGAQISLLSWGGQPESGLVLSQIVAALGTRPHTPLIASHCVLRVPRPPPICPPRPAAAAAAAACCRNTQGAGEGSTAIQYAAVCGFALFLQDEYKSLAQRRTFPTHSVADCTYTGRAFSASPALRRQGTYLPHRFACGATARGNTRPPAVDDGAPLPQLSVRPQCPCSRSTLFFTSWSKDSHLCLSSQGSLPMLLYP